MAAYRLHGVIHGHEGLQALPLEHVGEFHVDGLHGPRVAHDPVLVGVGCVVVARRAGGQTHTQWSGGGERRGVLGWPPTHPGHEQALALSCLQASTKQPCTWGKWTLGSGALLTVESAFLFSGGATREDLRRPSVQQCGATDPDSPPVPLSAHPTSSVRLVSAFP